jgi:photosystem II stability/assembly factor-like uncharacterized protein
MKQQVTSCHVHTDPFYDKYTYHDRGSWKKTLADKAAFFEANAEDRHNILGTYPSSVRLVPPKHYAGLQEGAWQQIIETGELPPGWTFDQGTTGLSNVAHTSSWTAALITAEAFRVAFSRKQFGEDSAEYRAAYERAGEVIGGIRVLTLVTGQPGYLARGVALGHGVSYEEREGAGTRDLWAQGAGEYSHMRYRGGPSHHNYDQMFRGLGTYYFVAADDAQKDQVREIVKDMSDWAHLKHDMTVMHLDGKRISTELIGGWRMLDGDTGPSGGSLMALAGLKIASTITGNEQVRALYDKWIDHLGFRDAARNQSSIMGEGRGNYDDTDHLVGDLYLLTMIEEDETLKAYYRKCVRDSWEAHKVEKMAWFNYAYWAVLGEEHGDPEGSLWNLQTHPTCRVFQPRMNSIRTDIELKQDKRRMQSLHPLPVHERASDNEYEWKGSPFALDGWLSCTVSVLEVSPLDAYVQFSTDASGKAYQSNTRGEIWHEMEGLPHVRDFLFSPAYPWMAFAATDGGVYRTLDGGARWSCALEDPVQELVSDPGNVHVLYAVGPGGVFRSQDLGERDTGSVWNRVSADAPMEGCFAVDPRGESATIYLLTSKGFFRHQAGASEWEALPQTGRLRGFSTVDPVGGKPLWLRVDREVPGRLFRAVATNERGPMVSVSDDAGATWSPVVRELKPLADWSLGAYTTPIVEEELRELMDLLRTYRFRDFRVQSGKPNVWYGLLEDGIAVSRDAGQTWSVSRTGLDIPRPGSLWAPRHASIAMVGTPAGMYVSNDEGETWTDTSLVIQEDGAVRSEIGGIGYLTAYWMGRYHGYITEEEANRSWWTE